ncbi:hypothetical protein R5R35_014321 [Gryllus longicercus]|uniref:Phosphatidylcholine transfer protein n=1 Tax=Gryllus longicercus TaxID=2509291 RepID=A0AAN9VD68_9ORTH
MIGRGLCKIFTSNIQKPAFIQCRKKNFIRDDHLHDIKLHSCFISICSFFASNVGKSNHLRKYTFFQNRKAFLSGGNNVFQVVKYGLTRIPLSLKEHSVQVVKMCTRQCEFVIAHRIRRGQQMFSLYTKMWDEVALKNLIVKIRKQFARRGRELLLSAAGVTAYNWEKMKITDKEINGFMKEIENCYHLREATVTCRKCSRRVIFDMQVPDVQYCDCSGSKAHNSSVEQGWVPFLERNDLIVWRKEHPECHGLYAYKVYASYDDVTAYDFLCVQLDTEYRKEWDHTAVELTILETDRSSNSDIIYWVMKWPRMFSNRDYVFNRRYKIDEKEKVMVVVNKCTEHPKCPEKYENIRVKKYWSSMVIRPHKEFDEPGIEYCLTYFDDPGVSIPSTITSWVAVSGLPDFLTRLREAARQLAIRRKHSQYHWIPMPQPDPEEPPKSTTNLPPDVTPKVPLTSSQVSHQEPQDSYLQLSTARLFL